MKLVQARLSGRKDRESTFQHCGGPVKQAQGCLSTRKDRDSRFHHCGGFVKLV